jgi:tetratricopeptide (TPR) repeat protein
MAKLPSQEAASLAFTEVFSFIEYLVGQKGWPGIRAVLRAMAGGKSDAEALEAVYGAPLETLEARWKATLPDMKVERRGGLRPVKGDRKLVIKDRVDTPDDELEGLSKEARRYARAADLLFARGRYVAAQMELEKAFDVSRSPLVSAKLATLALANDDLDKAETAARRSIESMPELAGPNVTLAEILLRRGKTDAMAAPLERALDINPFDPRIHRLRVAMLEDGDPEKRAEARRALALARQTSSPPEPLELGRGARIRVEGLPFARLYLTREGERFATRLVTPTPPIELRPGRWTIELQPPRGRPVTREVDVAPSEDVRTITVSGPPD